MRITTLLWDINSDHFRRLTAFQCGSFGRTPSTRPRQAVVGPFGVEDSVSDAPGVIESICATSADVPAAHLQLNTARRQRPRFHFLWDVDRRGRGSIHLQVFSPKTF